MKDGHRLFDVVAVDAGQHGVQNWKNLGRPRRPERPGPHQHPDHGADALDGCGELVRLRERLQGALQPADQRRNKYIRTNAGQCGQITPEIVRSLLHEKH